MTVDPLAEPWEFFRELECYADAENAEARRQHARQEREARRRPRSGARR